MSTTHLVIQIIAGIVGGNVVGFGMKNLSLGVVGNTFAGAIGGVAGGLLLGTLLSGSGTVTFFNVFTISGASEGFNAIVAQLIGGLAGGGIFTAMVGWIKNAITHPRVGN
jgi:hypothetical protein